MAKKGDLYMKMEGGQKKMSPLRSLVELLLRIISAVAGLALLLTLLAPYIAPQGFGILPTLALLAPATYIVNAMFALYWIVKWQWRYAIALLILICCGVPRIGLFANYSATKNYENRSYRGMVKVMSYNTRLLIDDKGQYQHQKVAEYLENEQPDIVALQEFKYCAEKMEPYMERLSKYHRVADERMMIMSRYPIVSSGSTLKDNIIAEGRSQWADIVVRGDTIRLFNNHLQTTDIKRSDNDYLTSAEIVRDTNRHSTVMEIFQRYTESCVTRARQANEISHAVAASPYQVILCGDFNDTPQSFAFNTMAQGLNDSFKLCGEGYAYTYRGFFNLLRIDYILTSEGLTPNSYSVDREFTVSDHLPVTSHINIKKL